MDIRVGGVSFREVLLPQLPLFGEMFDLISSTLDNLGDSDQKKVEDSLEDLRRISAECAIAAICLEKAYESAREELKF